MDKQQRIEMINQALKDLTQQEAYNLICDYKHKFEDIYPMIDIQY